MAILMVVAASVAKLQAFELQNLLNVRSGPFSKNTVQIKICLIEFYTMFKRICDAIKKHLGFSSILIACQIF